MLNTIKRNTITRAPIIVIHGEPGIGKTTFAANAPNPVFIPVEDGLGALDVATFDKVESFEGMMQCLGSLQGEHDFKTVIIDSMSALEPLVWDSVCRKHNSQSIEQVMGGYGKGYGESLKWWWAVLQECHALAERGITPILIAHSRAKATTNPELDMSYDQNQIKLQKDAFGLLYEQTDIIGYAFKPIYVKKADEKKLNEKNKAKEMGGRSLRLSGTCSTIAKNRYSMPDTIDLNWQEFSKHVPFYNK